MSRYRTVGNGSSHVDESLFGANALSNSLNSGRRSSKPASAPSTFSLASSIVLSQDELMRVKNASIIKSEAQMIADRELAQRVKAEKEKKAHDRKSRMKELEQLAVLKSKKSDQEVADEMRANTIRALAAEKMDKNKDVVKLLGSMSARAVAFTVRDRQLEEKEKADEEEREYDQRLNIIMEIDRLKDISRRENEEIFKKSKRIEDRKVINDQIAYRHTLKLLAAEAREQENQAMRTMMKRYADEDAKKAQFRNEEIARSKVEFTRANEEAIKGRAVAKNREKKDQEDILVYQAIKDAELRKREEDEAELEKSKRARLVAMLATQEKAQSTAGKADEIRARRAAEDRERKARLREREEAEKKSDEIKQLMIARAKQAADKKVAADKEQIFLDEEFNSALKYMAKMDYREQMEKKVKEERSKEHRTKTMAQIDERQKVRDSTLSNKFDEGYRLRQEAVREEAKFGVIRDKLVEELAQKGVNQKYLQEMKNVNVAKILNR